MGALKAAGVSQHGAAKSQHFKLPSHILALIADLVDCKNAAMLDAGQPGELPLMRELSSLRRLPSLRDPAVESNPVKGCSSIRTPHWKSPVFKARHDNVIVDRNRDIRVSGSPSFHVKPLLNRGGLSHATAAPSFSDPIYTFESERAWDLGMEADSSLYGARASRRPSLEVHRGTEIFQQRRASRKNQDDEFSLGDWMDPSWASDMEASHATSYSLQEPHRMPRRHRGGVNVPNGGTAALNSGYYGLAKRNFSDKTHGSKRMVEQRQRRTMPNCSKNQAQVLSPLTLNPNEDMHYQDQPFSLEGNSYARRSQQSRVVKKGFPRNNIPLAETPLYLRTEANKAQRGPMKGNLKIRPSLTSSSSTSQRTASHSSLSDPWEAPSNQLGDELDVCELPKNGCGIPCYWSRGQRRSKPLPDMAEKSFGCGLYPKSPRRMMHSCSKNYNLQFQSGHHGHEPVPPLELEALPLLSDASACSEDVVGTSDSDKISSHLNGELGIQGRGTSNGNSEERVSEGKELAVFRERPRSLSQKYRPRVLKELVGQSLAAQALSRAVQKGRIAPVYLFQGPRGTGKTSAARIFAAALNCIGLEQQKPCGSCKECLAFTSGKSNIREVDAASNNAVEKVKGLLQTAFLAPSFLLFKIFIIDECHMLTAESWNVLLMLLEEPPRNVVVILTTTDPEKLPAMALSRCQKLPFPKIAELEIVGRLETLALLEKLVVEPGALELVAARADGSLRDAEIILDQLSLLGQKISVSTVHELFGSVSDEKLLGLLDSALCSDTVNTVQRARELIDSGVEPLDLMVQLATLITDILAGSSDLLAAHNGGFFCNQALSDEELERLRLALQVLSDSEKQLRAASTDRTTWLTAALLQLGPARVCALSLSTSSASVVASPVVKAVSNNESRQVLKAVNGRNNYRGNMDKTCSQKKASLLKATGKQNRPLKSVFDAQVHPEEASKVLSAVLLEPFSPKAQTHSFLSSRRGTLVGPGNLEDIWCNVLERCQCQAIKQLMHSHGKLLAVSISADGAVVFLEFDTVESKSKGESCKKNIISVLQEVLGLSLDVKIVLSANARAATGIGARVQAIVDQQEGMNSQDELKQSLDSTRPPQYEHKLGSLHYWKSHSQAPSPRLERASSIRSFPVILSISKSNRVADSEVAMRSLSGTPRFANTGKFRRRADMYEGKGLSGSGNSKSRTTSSLQKTQNEDRVHEIVVDKGIDITDHVQQGVKALPDGFTYDIEEENLRLESQSKYGGLLCWRSSQVEDEEVSKAHQKRRCTMLMRLIPCGKSESKQWHQY